MKSIRDFIKIVEAATDGDAISKVKQLASIPINAIPRLGWAIDPKTGIIYYNNGASEIDGPAQGQAAPYGEAGKFWDFNSPAGATSEAGQLGALLRQAGLEVKPVQQQSLFGAYNVAAVDVDKLSTLGTTPAAPAAEPAAAPAAPAEPAAAPAAEPAAAPAAPAAAAPAAAPVRAQPASSGTSGQRPDPKVLYIQQTLKRLGADLGTTGPNKDGVDGIMGRKTREMMKKYNIDANGQNIAASNPNAPASGTQSNAVTTAAAAGNRAGDVENPNTGAFYGNTAQMQRDAKIAKEVANAPINATTGLPVDWPKWNQNQRRVWNNLQREQNRAGATAVTPANRPPAQPGVVKESGYDEVERLVSLIHYR